MNEGDPSAKIGIVMGESGAEYQTETVFDPNLERETTRLCKDDGPQPATLAEGE